MHGTDGWESVVSQIRGPVDGRPGLDASSEHVLANGTLNQAWASHTSFRPLRHNPGPARMERVTATGRATLPSRPRGATRSATGAARNGATRPTPARHVPMHGWPGSLTDRPASSLTHAGATAERDAALGCVVRFDGRRQVTLGADKGHDVQGFIAELRRLRATPHSGAKRRVSRTGVVGRSAIDGPTTRHPGYAVSQRKRSGSNKSSAG